jgi:hypothetical protein
MVVELVFSLTSDIFKYTSKANMPRSPVNPASLPPEERRLRSQLHQLLSAAEGFLHGSLIEMARRCGKPSCHCATHEEARHRSLYLGQTLKGKTTMEYVPKELEPTVRQWAGDFQLALDLLERLNQQGRDRLKARKQRAKVKTPAKKSLAQKTTKPKSPPPS